MATLNVINRWSRRKQMFSRDIRGRTSLDRDAVKKHLWPEDTDLSYAKRASSCKPYPYAEKLATWLEIEATKSRKQRRNLQQIYSFKIASVPSLNRVNLAWRIGLRTKNGPPKAVVLKRLQLARSGDLWLQL